MNGLKLNTSTSAAKGPIPTMATTPGQKHHMVPGIDQGSPENKASNNPGPMTAPSTQGPTQPITERAK